MPNDPHVPRGQAHRPTDVIGVAFVDERREDHVPRSSLELVQAGVEARAISEGPRQFLAVGQRRRGCVRDPTLACVTAPHVHHHVATRPEDVGVQVVDLPHAAGPERLQNYEQHLLHKILRGGAVPQMAKAVGADPVRIPLADGALVLGFHETRSTTLNRRA